MTRGTKIAIVAVSFIGAGVGCYFYFRKSKEQIKVDILALGNADERDSTKPILDKMTRQELLDVYKLYYAYRYNKPLTDNALKQRLSIISQKYNIFT